MRTITEILKEADVTDDIDVISNAWKEIKLNLKKYPLCDIQFAKEHLNNLAGALGTKHAKQVKPFVQPLLDILNNT